MKNELDKFRNSLISLCERVLLGELSVTEFFSLWPAEISKTEFIAELFDDLEEGVEHFPAHILSGKKDSVLWTSSHMAQKIRVDMQLLISGLCDDDMLSLRSKILADNVKDEGDIKKMIKEFRGRASN